MDGRLSLFRFGAALGIAVGGLLTAIGLLAWMTGVGVPLVMMMSTLLRGYGPGPVAAVLGGAWGAGLGFPLGAALAWLYNRLVSL
jgi:hypothetical protein